MISYVVRNVIEGHLEKIMDNPLGFNQRLNNYSQVMARQHGRSLLELSNRVSHDFIKDNTLANKFRHEILCFVNDKINKCQESGKASTLAIQELKQEYRALQQQENMLRTNKVTPYAVMKKKLDGNSSKYVLAGIGLLSGIGQIILGIGLDWTGVAVVPGTLLMVNGINNVYENAHILFLGKNVIGPARIAYRASASFLGYDEDKADIVYGGVDLLLSGYGALRMSLKPEAWRLFNYINTDYVRAWRNMGKGAMGLEIAADGATIETIYHKGSGSQ